MRKFPAKYFTILLFFCTTYTIGQTNKNLPSPYSIDSLRKCLKNSPDDTNKVCMLSALSSYMQDLGYSDSSLKYAKAAQTLAEKIRFIKNGAESLNGIGNNYFELGDYSMALEYYYKALTTAQENANKIDIARALGNIGNVYLKQGNYPKALEYYFKALKLSEDIGNKQSTASHLSNLAIAYEEQGNYAQALEYNFKSLNIAQEIKDKYIISHTLDNIGVIYDKQGDYVKSLEYEFRAQKIGLEIGNRDNLIDIGAIYGDQGNYPKALEYYSMALDDAKKSGYKDEVANLYSNVGSIYTKLQNYRQAGKFLDSALIFSKKLGDKINIKNTYLALSVLDSALGNYKTSHEDYEKYIVYRDSLINQESVRKITEMEISYRYEKREDSIKAEDEKNNIIKTAEIKRKGIITNSAIVISILVILLAILLINRQQIKLRKDKIIFEKEKLHMEGELKNAQKTLAAYINSMVEKNTLLDQFKRDLEEFKNSKAREETNEKRIEQLEYLNKATILTEEDWDKFKGLFEQVHKGFFIRLKEKLPNLTNAEVRLLCLTKLKLDTKQMASVIGVSSTTIEQTRYRLRKKLNLSKEDSLSSITESV